MSSQTTIGTILERVFAENPPLRQLYEERLAETGLKNYQVAKLLGIERKSLNPIVDGTAKQSDLIKVIKLGEFLGLNTSELLGAFFANRDNEELKELERVRKASFIAKHFNLPKLKEIGFLDSIVEVDYISNRISTFFGLNSIYEFEDKLEGVLYSRTKNNPNTKMIDFWVKSAYGYFEGLDNPNDYNRELLKDIISKIRPYTRNEENGLLIVIKALYNAGVTVVFQEHLSKTSIRGATMVVNEKPCIVLTDLNQNYATIWFALVHELHHVLYDLDTIRDTNFHLTGEPDLFLIEEGANEFAREILFSQDKMNYIKPFINNHVVVADYAREVNVHPCIIYSFFQYDMNEQGKNYWSAFKKYFPDISKTVDKINPRIWESESILSSIEMIKEIIS